MTRICSLLALVGLATVCEAAPIPKCLKHTKPPMNGTWEVVEWYSSGAKINSGLLQTWTIDGEDLVIQRKSANGNLRAVPNKNVTTLTPQPEAGSHAIDYTIAYTTGRVVTYKGVVEVDGDSMKFCYTSNQKGLRPTECKEAQGNILYVFQKAEK